MRIWWVNHVALPPTEAGVTRHFDFARQLIEHGHDVTVILSNFHYIRRQEIRNLGRNRTKLELIQGVPFLWIRTPPYGSGRAGRVRSWLVFAARLWRGSAVRDLPPPDVIVGSSPYPFAALAAHRLARRLGVPFVLEVRDLWPQTLIELGEISPRHPFIILLDRIERFLYRQSDAIVSLLPQAADYLVAKGADPDRITWIPNGVDVDAIPHALPPNGQRVFTVMYAGGHGPMTDLDDVLDAAAILRDSEWAQRIRIHLVGDGTEKKRLIRRAELERLDNVVFEDHVPKNQIYDLLQRADAFVVVVRASPLYKFGVSFNKFFDYLAMARPTVIASKLESNPFEQAGAGFLAQPGDPASLASAIVEVATLSAAKRHEMGRRGRAYVREHYHLPMLASRLERVLDGVRSTE